MTALVLFAVTVAVTVLLAAVFHEGVAAAVVLIVGILATVPGAYLTWAALPGATKMPVRGQRAGLWDPLQLGVHRVIGGGPMPTYIRRQHDELLRAVLDPGVHASRLVVVRGGSSTGKTRAVYEAVADQLSDWQLDYPRNATALASRLDAGVPALTVLWLGELRQYVDADGAAAVLGRLADLLDGDGHLVITTMWPQHWSAYTDAARARPGLGDPTGVTGRLLAGLPELTGRDPAGIDPAQGGVIDVPDRFAAADLDAAAHAGDRVLAEAVAAAADAGLDGQVTQYLAGVPDLLARYEGPGGDPYGQAVIKAGMDAARLGHADPMPPELLIDAAVGYLTSAQRTASIETWRDDALAWAAKELRGAVQALRRIPPATGTGVIGYQIADYLDQYGRRTRQDQLGPPSLWNAFTTHAVGASDLIRLGQAAQDRGLYRQAAALWTAAATDGSPAAAITLVYYLRQVSPGDAALAARWAVGHVSLDDPYAVTHLMEMLRVVGASDATTVLAARAAGQVNLDDDPEILNELVVMLRKAGATDAVHALASRGAAQLSSHDPSAVTRVLRAIGATGDSVAVATLASEAADQASLEDPRAVAELLRALRETGNDGAATRLAARAVDQVGVGDLDSVADLLNELAETGLSGEVTALASRAVSEFSLDDAYAATTLLEDLCEAGATAAARIVASRAAAQVSLDDPSDVAGLLMALHDAGASDAVTTLLARDPAARVSLGDAQGVAVLVYVLHESGASDAAHALTARVAAQISVDDLVAVAELLEALRETGAVVAARTLLARDPAAQASLVRPWFVATLLGEVGSAVLGREFGYGNTEGFDNLLGRDTADGISMSHPWGVVVLVRALREAGATDAVTTLGIRAADQVTLDDPRAIACLLRELCEAGAGDVATTLAARAARQVSLDEPYVIARLLTELHKAGASGAVTTLAMRVARQVSLDDPGPVARLLQAFHEAGAPAAIHTLLNRDPAAHVSLDHPSHVADLLKVLREAGAVAAARTLLDRDPAAHVSLDHPGSALVRLNSPSGVPALLRELGEAGDSDAATALAKRAADAGMFDLFLQAQPNQAPQYSFGREPEGTPSQPWRWQELTSQDRS